MYAFADATAGRPVSVSPEKDWSFVEATMKLAPEDAARREQAAWPAGNAQWRPALFPVERIGGLASLQPATLRLAVDVRYGSWSSENSRVRISPRIE